MMMAMDDFFDMSAMEFNMSGSGDTETYQDLDQNTMQLQNTAQNDEGEEIVDGDEGEEIVDGDEGEESVNEVPDYEGLVDVDEFAVMDIYDQLDVLQVTIKALEDNPDDADLLEIVKQYLEDFSIDPILNSKPPGSVAYYEERAEQGLAPFEFLDVDRDELLANNPTLASNPLMQLPRGDFDYDKCVRKCKMEDTELQVMLDFKAPFVDKNLKAKKEQCIEKCDLYNEKGEYYSPFPFATDFEETVEELRQKQMEETREKKIEQILKDREEQGKK